MAKYRVTFDIVAPDDATDEEVETFVEFEVGANGFLPLTNSLSNSDIHSLNAMNVIVERI